MSKDVPKELSVWNLPFYHGKDIQKLRDLCKTPRKAIIEALIYEHSASLFWADDGVGKSILLFQAIFEASAGHAAFSFMECPRPVRTLWIQAERHPYELGERINALEKVITPDYSNLIITSDLQEIDLRYPKHVKNAIDAIDTILKQTISIDLIVIDPIYSMVSGELTSGDTCGHITKFSTLLQSRYDCSTVFIHHSNRGGRGSDGTRTEGDIYGNRFLTAHFSGIYSIKRREDGSGSVFKCKKDTFSVLNSGFQLDYDKETWVSTVSDDSISKTDQIGIFLRAHAKAKTTFTFNDIYDKFGVSPTLLYHLRGVEYVLGFIETGKLLNRKKLYRSELT